MALVGALSLSAPTLSRTAQAQPGSPPPIADPLPFIGSVDNQLRIAEQLGTMDLGRLRRIGTSSVSFRVELDSVPAAAFRPRTHVHGSGHRAEVAAYRIAHALGMENVPPSVMRGFTTREIYAHLHPDYRDEWDYLREDIITQRLGEEDHVILGAMTYWIPEMRSSELDRNEGIEQWSQWLSQAQPTPEDKRSLAADLSSMLLLDYLIGNWDRFSGSNVKTNESGDRLFVRDHNLAFQTPLRPHLHERVSGYLVRCQRFSRSVVIALAGLDEARLRAELARDPASRLEGAGLALEDDEIAQLEQRRLAALSYIGSLIEAHGERAVLSFP